MTCIVSVLPAKSPRMRDTAVIAAGILTGLLTPTILDFVGDSFYPHGFAGSPGMVYASGGIPYAVLIASIARLTARVERWRALAFGVATLVAMSTAIVLSANTNGALAHIAEPRRELVGGPVGGLVGSGLMALAAGLLRIGPKNPARWSALVVVGTALGALLALDDWLGSEKVWVTFPVWQASTALIILRTLQNARATDGAA